MEVWFAPFERVRQSGGSFGCQFRFLRGKALIQFSIQISVGLGKATTRSNIVMRVSAYRSRESLVSENLYQTCLLQLPFHFSYPFTSGDFGLFQDVLRILNVGFSLPIDHESL